MDSFSAILKTANEGLDRIIDERDAAIAQVALLRQACIEARQWILCNDDLENDSADWPLHLIKEALKASGEPSEAFPMTRALLSLAATEKP